MRGLLQRLRLPVKLDTSTNGEFAPRPLSAPVQRARALAHARLTDNARRVGLSRRQFLTTTCGAATTLLAMNDAFAAEGTRGSTYAVDREAAFDEALARHALAGNEFIFDVQTHHVDPTGPWRSPLSSWNLILRAFPQARCKDGFFDRVFGSVDCFAARHLTKEVFLDSDTDMAVLSFVPATDDTTPLTLEAADETRRIVEAMDGNHRLLLHGRVNPNVDGDLGRMGEILERWDISAWKTYTQYGPGLRGYYLDDETHGRPFLENVRKTSCKNVCIHKGLPLPGYAYEFSTCRDVGPAARAYPDINFIVYHSGYEPFRAEGPYRPSAEPRGIDSLIQSLQENDVPPGSNVYAELGSTWKLLMRDPDSAAHAIGKLLRYVGEDRVLWGTDSIWYGSPQDQIQAFRSFQIAPELREAHGYPEITPELRAKIFGLNATVPYGVELSEVKARASADRIDGMRQVYAEAPQPSLVSYGPRTREEYLGLLDHEGGVP